MVAVGNAPYHRVRACSSGLVAAMTKTMWPTTAAQARKLLLFGFALGAVFGVGVMLVLGAWL